MMLTAQGLDNIELFLDYVLSKFDDDDLIDMNYSSDLNHITVVFQDELIAEYFVLPGFGYRYNS